ncbi:hypothetical protein JCM10296v2_004785 [Rhodotorula toruloides]
MPRVEEAEDMLIEGLEKRIGEGGVWAVHWLPSRKREARLGSMMEVLWNDEMVSRITEGNGDLWSDPAVYVRCEKARGRKEMTHREEAGKPKVRAADAARTAPGKPKNMQKGAAGAQEQKKREASEEKGEKDEPAGANLAKSGSGSLASSPSLVGNGRKSPITTTTTASTPTNPFEPILPPGLSDFSIERSVGDDFGAVLDNIAVSAGAKGQQSDGIEARVSEDSSFSPDSRNAPASPALRASPITNHLDATPSTGASAPSTSDLVLVVESPLSSTLAARRQEAPAPSFL